jgi:BMFP domain-containing protein YqiC
MARPCVIQVGTTTERAEAEMSTVMSTVSNAWVAFIHALEEARDLQHRGADAHTLADLLRHARERLDIIDDEIADGTPQTVADARAVLAQLRGRLESLEQDVMPTMH